MKERKCLMRDLSLSGIIAYLRYRLGYSGPKLPQDLKAMHF